MLGIGAHEPHGFADFAGCPADYFAAVFAPLYSSPGAAPGSLRGTCAGCAGGPIDATKSIAEPGAREHRTRRATCARGGSARRTGTARRSRSQRDERPA
jgi:hypothetical protein